mmetsp:Transcript_144315/g.448114  ORF Transcript_144315/g.448114 Transcript_144315/m.448114 type:complete len:169 (-) Transcript_144315:18-524(-)
MDRRTSSTAGPTCTACKECTAEAGASIRERISVLNRCVRSTVTGGIKTVKNRVKGAVNDGIDSVKDNVRGHIASAQERAGQHIDRAKSRADAFWARLRSHVVGDFDAHQPSLASEPGDARGALAVGSLLAMLPLAGVAAWRAARGGRSPHGSAPAGEGARVEEGALLE